jgi:putative ABC transport system permease protein
VLVKILLRDVRFGLRLLRRNPGFTTVAVVALSVGIAATTAIFSVIYATLLAPLPYHDPDRLVMVWSRIQGTRNVTATADYLDWKNQSTVFDGLSAWTGRSINLATGDRPEQVQASAVTPGWTTTIGYRMLLGRDFRQEEGTVGKDQVVILTYQLWKDRFGAERGIVGRQIRLNGKPYTVVGVIEPGPADRVQNKLYVPLAFTPDQINHDFHYLLVLGRLKPGVTLAQANANMQAVTKHIAEANPKSNMGWSASVEPLQNNFLSRETINGLWLMLGAVAFVLLIACANVANLQLARGTARQREIAVRASLGASPGRLFRQLLTESVVVAVIGGALGVVLAWGLLKVIMTAMPPYTLPSEADVRLNLPVLLFTLAASFVCGILFGCLPAWQAMRSNMNETIKEGARSVAGGRHRLRRALVVAEFALALTLLAGGGLAIHSLVKLANVDLGFRRDHLLTFSLPVPEGALKGNEAVNAFYRQLLERISALPGVTSASVSTGMPVYGTGFGMPFYFAGKPVDDPSKRPGVGFNMVSPDYYRTFGIRMTRGRAFTDHDREGTQRVAIVNDIFVKRYLSGIDPLTQRIMVEQLIPGVTKLGPPLEWQIVGVYSSVRNGGPKDDGFPEIDVPFWQSPWPGVSVAVRTAGDPAGAHQSLAAVIRSLDADLPMADVKTMDQVVEESLAGDRFSTTLLAAFAAVALLLAAVGIYGVMSFVVAQRTHEIGLRMALGAGRGRVVWQVLREGLGSALGGIVLGSAGAYLVGRAMQGMVYGVGAIDPLAFSLVALALFTSALLACLVPARRAVSVDPMIALRAE